MLVEKLYNSFLGSSGVTTDSRVAAPGMIFFALRGDNFDAHIFVEQALNAGCSLAVIDNREFSIPGKTYLVKDVLAALQELASYHRQHFNIPVIAITGSNGKTTTKEIIREVLAVKYNTLSTSGNLNNHIGVPLTLLELNSSHQIAVIEMGANHIGEIEVLCNIARPTHGLITNIGSAHLEGFGSLEGVKKAKSELFVYLKRTGGTAFVNADRPILKALSEQLDLNGILYGRGEKMFVTGKILDSIHGVKLKVIIKEAESALIIQTKLTGSYNFENIMAAVSTGMFFGVPPEMLKAAIENYTPSNNRSQLMDTLYNRLLLDAYNANPDSMRASLINFNSMPGKDKSVILGDMLELGDYADQEHEKIIMLLGDQQYNEVFLVGELFCNITGPADYLRFENVEKLIAWLKDNPLRHRFILLKGSRGLKLEKCVTVL